MPLTASLQMSPGSVQAGQVATATLVLANAGAGALVIQSISCFVTPHSSTQQSVPVQVGQPNWGPGFPRSVPANGSITITFPVVGATSARDLGEVQSPSTVFYDVHALTQVNDATNVEAIAALTIGSGLERRLDSGMLDFSQPGNVALLL